MIAYFKCKPRDVKQNHEPHWFGPIERFVNGGLGKLGSTVFLLILMT